MLVNKKMILIATLTAVALLAFTYGTYAYLSEQATIEDSRITPGNISIELLEMTLPTGGDTPVPQSEPIHIMPGAEVSKRVSVKNTGTLPTYVRIKIAPSVMLAEDAAERADEVDLSLIRLNVNSRLTKRGLTVDASTVTAAPPEGGKPEEPPEASGK